MFRVEFGNIAIHIRQTFALMFVPHFPLVFLLDAVFKAVGVQIERMLDAHTERSLWILPTGWNLNGNKR